MKFIIRNIEPMPNLDKEGKFTCPFPSPPPQPDKNVLWYAKLKPFDRLYYHQTLSSVRQSKRFVSSSKIPRDSLDFQLQSRYIHSKESFPDKVDFVLQRETCCDGQIGDENERTFRVLRNIRTVEEQEEDELGHPLRIGGVREKLSPHSVKLINSGPHTQLVNNGYSRQPADGNFFRY